MGDQFVVGETSPSKPEKGRNADVLDSWRQELAESYVVMKNLGFMDPSDVFLRLSQFSARASEMRSQMVLHEGRREYAFRTKIIDPFIEECERQFKFHSRLQAIREMDARLAGGHFA